jgi:hypothetical protein
MPTFGRRSPFFFRGILFCLEKSSSRSSGADSDERETGCFEEEKWAAAVRVRRRSWRRREEEEEEEEVWCIFIT